ncbi:prolyl oligopeptidase family serine peptidase [Bacteroides sp. ET71]|uniref:prolyl oligopeptidase family serine peptidase n=1 Tax=Bacteroides sp. ET71 TaxID=2939421 RepID=UPI003979F2FD
MKPIHFLCMSAIILAATSACDGGKKNSTDTPGTEDSLLIRRSDIRIENKRLTPEALWAMGRIGGVAVSPDASKVAYTVSYYSVPQNKSNTEIFLMNADGSGNTQLTQDAWQENQPVWIKEGKKLAYLSNESGSTQVWQMDPDGTNRRQLTDYEGGIEGFAFSPDGKKLLFIAQVKTVKTTAEKYPDLPKASGIIVDDLMYKHWDEWTTSAPHPFVADFDGDEISNVRDLLEGEPYESPMKPFGGIEQLAWSPDSKKIAYTCRKKTGLAYAVSTDSDIYLYDLKSDSTLNLCKDPEIKKMVPLEIKKALAGTPVVKGVGLSPEGDKNEGYDTNPQFSPDGKYIAWQSMARDGYESDRNRLYVLDLEKNEKFCADAGFDTNVDSYVWASDSMFYLTATWHGTTQIYRLGLNDWREGKQPVRLTEGLHDYGSIALCGNNLIATRHSMSQADEIYVVAPGTAARNQYAESRQLTQENRHIYDQLEMGRVEERWIKTTDQKDMLVWVIYPPQFDPKKKYPTLLYCEGGPQSPLSQFWSYRWNFQMMAANDYIIVAPCRRGMPGFGTEWNEDISGDYGGQCMQDLLTAIDEVSKEPFVDRDHLGCVGASFGGFTVYWMAGHHEGRFKAFIAHDGIFNMEMQYLETEEKWFANWDMGGAYWDKENETAQRTFANSPHKFVDKWDTPILCIHGERDYRILANQAMAAFDAAKLRGIPAELLIFPDENHWVLQPQNGVLWQRTFFAWLDRWLKPAKEGV